MKARFWSMTHSLTSDINCGSIKSQKLPPSSLKLLSCWCYYWIKTTFCCNKVPQWDKASDSVFCALSFNITSHHFFQYILMFKCVLDSINLLNFYALNIEIITSFPPTPFLFLWVSTLTILEVFHFLCNLCGCDCNTMLWVDCFINLELNVF